MLFDLLGYLQVDLIYQFHQTADVLDMLQIIFYCFFDLHQTYPFIQFNTLIEDSFDFREYKPISSRILELESDILAPLSHKKCHFLADLRQTEMTHGIIQSFLHKWRVIQNTGILNELSAHLMIQLNLKLLQLPHLLIIAYFNLLIKHSSKGQFLNQISLLRIIH